MIDKYRLMTIRDRVMEYALSHQKFTIPEISESFSLSSTTIAKTFSELLEKGEIVVLGEQEDAHTRGRRAMIYALCSSKYKFIGVDIRKSNLEIGISDFSGKIIKQVSDNSFRLDNTYENLEYVCSQIESFVENTLEMEMSGIEAIGVSIGGRVNSQTGKSATIYNLEEIQDSSLTDFLSRRLGRPVFIENDSKLLAWAEYEAQDKKYANVLYINAGWGLGMGVIVDGKLLRGRDGYSGEIGHMPTYSNNVICRCGKRGCVETEVSGSAVARKLQESLRSGQTSVLATKINAGKELRTEDIIQAVNGDDPLCQELVSAAATELGRHVAGMINLFNPECVILGGRMAEISPFYFFAPATLSIQRYSLGLIRRNVDIVSPKLGKNAGIIGACMLARKRALFEKSAEKFQST